MTKTIDEGRAALIERAAQVLNARRLRTHEWPTMQEFAQALSDAGLLSDWEEIRKVLEAYIDAIQRIAFNIPAPNPHTPMIVQACVELRAALSSPSVSSEKTPVEFPMTDPRNQDYD